MAVFTNKADFDLPVLTQVYQAESRQPPYEDVQTLYRRWRQEPDPMQLEENRVHTLARVFNLIRDLMDDIESGEGINPSVANEVDKWLEMHKITMRLVSKETNKYGKIEESAFQEHRSGVNNSVMNLLVDEMYLLLKNTGQEKLRTGTQTRLMRCAECHSVCLRSNRRPNLFCSHRCETRANVRKRRANRKQIEQVANVAQIAA